MKLLRVFQAPPSNTRRSLTGKEWRACVSRALPGHQFLRHRIDFTQREVHRDDLVYHELREDGG